MAYICSKIEGDYEITQYTGGGTVRRRLDGEIVAEYVNYWTAHGSIHEKTQKEIDYIKEKLGITITP